MVSKCALVVPFLILLPVLIEPIFKNVMKAITNDIQCSRTQSLRSYVLHLD